MYPVKSYNIRCDALGRRVGAWYANLMLWMWTYSFYDGQRILADMYGDGLMPLRYYVYGKGIDEPLMLYTKDYIDCDDDLDTSEWLPFYYHQNHLGSVTSITDYEGEMVERYEFDVYGLPTIFDKNGSEITNRMSPLKNPFMFTGREWDGNYVATGLYHYRARAYDPETGKFLQKDNISGLNLYAYVGNRPTVYIDPWGLQEEKTQTNEPIYTGSDLIPGIVDNMLSIKVKEGLESLKDLAKNIPIDIAMAARVSSAVFGRNKKVYCIDFNASFIVGVGLASGKSACLFIEPCESASFKTFTEVPDLPDFSPSNPHPGGGSPQGLDISISSGYSRGWRSGGEGNAESFKGKFKTFNAGFGYGGVIQTGNGWFVIGFQVSLGTPTLTFRDTDYTMDEGPFDFKYECICDILSPWWV